MNSTSQAAPSLPPIPPDIASKTGPPLIAFMLVWFLYGVTVMQVYIYYQWFPKDKIKIKALVYGMFFLDTLQSILVAADAFHWFALGFGNLNLLVKPVTAPFDAPILEVIMALVEQTFFCWRLRVLHKSWWLPSSILLIAISGVVGGIASGIGGFKLGNLALLYTLKWQLSLSLAAMAVTDTLIAVAMTILVKIPRPSSIKYAFLPFTYKQLLRLRTGEMEQTDNVLTRIVRLTVETNTVTASVGIISVVCLFATPHGSTIVLAPTYALGKLYVNTLLAILNNRYYMTSRGRFLPNCTVLSSGMEIQFGQPPAELLQGQTTEAQRNSQAGQFKTQVFCEAV
ncbi:hypothetical protein E4T56_gene908 [Termitomyces sp. T112]|nr:hypothetical protein E4T56_gene908 [Termitomyces sp. T112]